MTRISVKNTVRSGQVSTRSPYTGEKEKNVTMFHNLKGRVLFSNKHREFPEAKFFWDLKTHLGCLVILHVKKKNFDLHHSVVRRGFRYLCLSSSKQKSDMSDGWKITIVHRSTQVTVEKISLLKYSTYLNSNNIISYLLANDKLVKPRKYCIWRSHLLIIERLEVFACFCLSAILGLFSLPKNIIKMDRWIFKNIYRFGEKL